MVADPICFLPVTDMTGPIPVLLENAWQRVTTDFPNELI